MSRFNARFSGLVPHARLSTTSIDVIGCGTIGRPLALQLAAMGAKRVTLWDDDSVCEENLGNQGWTPADIGKPKVDVLRLPRWTARQERVSAESRLRGEVRFYCVDSAAARRDIASAPGGMCHIDGRIGGEACQIVCGDSGADIMPTIPRDDEVSAEPCGRQSTIYIGYVCSGLMLSQFARWLRGEPMSAVYQSLGTAAGRWGAVL